MKLLIGKAIYSSIILIIIFLLLDYFKINTSWFVDIIFISISWFLGSFIYTQRHGIQVIKLRHLPSTNVDHSFEVVVKISGLGNYILNGKYVRAGVYSDLVLQSKFFKAVNKFPGNKWTRQFVIEKFKSEYFVSFSDQDSAFQETVITIDSGEKIQ